MTTPATEPRTTMNGKPVFRVPIKTAINLKSGFKEKLLCDGPTFALGDACAYECAFCYVPAMIDKLDRVQAILKASGLKHEDVVILREALVETVRYQLLHPNGKPKWKTADDRRVIYASPLDDVAANMDLVRATVEVCALILEHTNWQIRLLSKSNLLPLVPELLAKHARCDRVIFAGDLAGFTFADIKERMIFGVSTGTLDDRVARVRPSLPKPSLTPEERKIWLASHNAPADMLMISAGEFRQMTVGMINGQRALISLKTSCEETANHLDNYWRTQPDLPTAARAAVHDAKRFHRIAERCLTDVDVALSTVQTLANLTDGGVAEDEAMTVELVITEFAEKLGETLAFIKSQMALPLPPEEKPGLDLTPPYPPKP